MRAVRFSVFLLRSRAVIKVVLKAASALQNTDGEQIELRKFSAPLLQKHSGNFCRRSKGKVCFSLFRAEFSGSPLHRLDRTDQKITVPLWQTG